MKIKEIYSFSVNKKIKREVTEEGENDTKIVKTVEETEPIKIIFKNPSRQEREEADLVYAVEYGRCVRAGVLTAPLIQKLYDDKDKGGILSDNFAQRYLTLYEKFFELQNEFTKLDLKDNKTIEDEEKVKDLGAEFAQIRQELQTLESSRNSLFQNTAETKAQNKTITWLTLFLTYIREPGKEIEAFFKGSTYDEKMNHYDKLIEDNEDFAVKVIDKMGFFVSLWYLRRIGTKEEFAEIERNLNETAPAEVKEEVKPEDKPDKKEEKVAETNA